MRAAALIPRPVIEVTSAPSRRAIYAATLDLMQVDSCCAAVTAGALLVALGVRWLWWHRRRTETLYASAAAHESLAIFVTGCDSGLGFEIALLLDRLGFTVFAGCLIPSGDGANDLRKRASSRLMVINVDVTNQLKVDSALAVIEKIIKERHLTGLWAVINNAGVYVMGLVEWFTWEQCQRQVEVNLLGPIRVTMACLPLLKKTKGRIVNVSSFSGTVALPYRSVYCATKSGLESFSDSLRIEQLKNGVHVAVVRMSNHSRLTHICSGQTREACVMWKAMNAKTRAQYRQAFWQIYFQKGTPSPLGPYNYTDTTVLQDIAHAVTSPRPQARYTSGTFWDVTLFHLVSRLPNYVRDLLVSQELNKDKYRKS